MSTDLCIEFDWGCFDEGARYSDRMAFLSLVDCEVGSDVIICPHGGENRFRPKDFHKIRMKLVDAEHVEPKDVWHRLINLLERNKDLWLCMSY